LTPHDGESMKRVRLGPGRESSLQRRHPWIFSGAIQSVEGSPTSGETVDVVSSSGEWLARGAWSPQSQIRVRVWTFDPDENIDAGFFRARLQRALRLREAVLPSDEPTARRCVHAESDGLPGITVDRYRDHLVCQILSAGGERWKEVLVEELRSLLPVRGIYERSDTDARAKEGLPVACGPLWGEEPPELIEIREGGLNLLVDVRRGHKTGFYLDQRDNRALVGRWSGGREVLNCFAYTGAFGLFALQGGATAVTHVESSGELLELARRNGELNRLDSGAVNYLEDDVFRALRRFRDARRSFDLIILDPPKFVASASQLERGSRGYKDINLLAIKLLRPGGLLFTFSCSAHVTPALFQKIVADAALDARRSVQILRPLFQASDHPVALAFPEGLYLKGFLCRVV
jgi:23S rRNA (cytosine1962-C5)-methyltransferase